MSKLKKLGTLGTIGVLVTGGLILGSSPANAVTCTNSKTLPTNSLTGTTVTATSFEAASFSPFVATTAGTGTATVSTSQRVSGTCSAKLHVTSDSGSLAKLSLSLGSAVKKANADGWFNITRAGLTGNDVPYLRFFTNGTRIADIYRYNSNGQLWLRITAPNGTFSYTKLKSSTIPLSTWHRAQMEVTANGSASTVKVWFDGALEFSSSAVNLGVSSLTHVQLGAEHSRQMGDEYIDNVIVKKTS
ncbi:hypothetical protein [Arthrobacter globiformis]|uniref:hypothetical protein n=1 Tax=Arthrobacter globiformis TaxID=1665 RepID=UPI002787DDE3|nr:hypothetical protein [Arthrobacter globiformis]MDQ0867113.1 hypothetical protein [Arthrobacter globiformis]